MGSKRVVLSSPPAGDSTYHHEKSPWAAKWIGHPQQAADEPGVVAYRCHFTLESARTIRVHVSADERYELFLDGEQIGRGPERGDRDHWYFETYDWDLGAGEHVVVARTWWMGSKTPAPYAQMTVRPGFFLHAEGEDEKLLSTGVAKWDAKKIQGYSFSKGTMVGAFTVVGSRTVIDAAKVPWGYEKGDGDGWEKAVDLGNAGLGWLAGEWPVAWLLWPAMLPAMTDNVRQVGEARHIDGNADADAIVHGADHIGAEVAGWHTLLAGKAPLNIPARTTRRVIVDLANYYTAYPELIASGGKGAKIAMRWAEGLFVAGGHIWDKGNRNEIEGKVFKGFGDAFIMDGGAHRLFHPLWWSAGRYVEFVVTTADEALTIDTFHLREIHYPYVFENSFESSDAKLGEIVPLAMRTLKVCSNETYFDCPYYEQLMYVGDTRLDVLVSYTTSRDDRLPRKAVETFDFSRTADGFTHARYPTHVHQFIPPFSLWWVGMVHDYAMWREDREFVSARMPGVRAVLDAYRKCMNADGLVGAAPGWNFCDWVPGWASGVPPKGEKHPVATINFQAAWIYRQAAELEAMFGEVEMALRNRKTADRITTAAVKAFWDEGRGLMAENLEHQHFSEHAQCLALLGGSVPENLRNRVADHLFTDGDLVRTTIYFTHYLFETCAMTGRMETFFKRLGFWSELKKQGFKTTVEMPEPSRSDCHAWGAHPVYHYYATVLGIRPASSGFGTVIVRPQLGSLEFARGQMVHPKGKIVADFKKTNGRISGSIELPEGVKGTLVIGGQLREISGRTRID